MLGNIVKQEIIFYVMVLMLVIGFISKVISVVTTRKMVKAAGEIHKSNHRLMKLMKSKFEHASMVSDKVYNVEAFVEKYLYEYRVFGVRLHTWRAIPKKIIWVIGLLGVFAAFESYRMEGVSKLMLEYTQWTGIFLLFMLLVHFVAEEKIQLEATKNYIVEYLENVCVHRYEKMNRAVSETKEMEKAEEAQETVEPETVETEVAQISEEQKKNEREMRIRAILEEFLA